jgi:hypothetical protein
MESETLHTIYSFDLSSTCALYRGEQGNPLAKATSISNPKSKIGLEPKLDHELKSRSRAEKQISWEGSVTIDNRTH